MPTATKQKKKPFGTSSRNEGVHRNHFTAPSRPGKENITQKPTSKDPPPRRDSKTPKASNLTTIGGAYGMGDEFMGVNPTRKKKHPKSKQRLLDRRDAAKKKPDPSPLKKPDPTAAAKSNSSLSSQQPKKKNPVRSIVSSALKRGKSDKSNNRDAEFTSTAEGAVAVNPPSSNESLSDMDTAGSTPEKYSPLITSPHEKPDPPTRSADVAVERKQSQRERVKHDQVVMVLEQEKKRPAPQFSAINPNQPVGNRNEQGANTQPPAAPMAPSKRRAGEDASAAAAASAALSASAKATKSKQADRTKVMEAMMNSCKSEMKEHVVGSVIGGASLETSHTDDMSEMTMMDDNASTTSMTTLGGNNPSVANNDTKKSSLSSGIPSQLNLPRGRVHPMADPNIARQANLIDEETIASHITNQRKPDVKRQPADQGSLSQMSFLPAGWKEIISKSKNKPYWQHPDFGRTWHYPGLPVALPDQQQSSQNHPELRRAPELKSAAASTDHCTDDDSMAQNSTSHLTLCDVAVEQGAQEEQKPQEHENGEKEHMPEENVNEIDNRSTTSSHRSKQPDPSPLAKFDPTPTHASSNQSQPTSPDTRRISEDYQKLLAPYQSIEKSVMSKALSVASSRQSKASFYDDNSSKCLTQEFAVTKDEEQVGVGTPSIGNSVRGEDDDNDPVEFGDAQNEEAYEEEDVWNSCVNADLNSLSSDHVDIDALLTQRKTDSPMSTIRETLNDASPSSVVSSIDYGNVDDTSHKSSGDGKSSARNSNIDDVSLNSDGGYASQASQETFSKSAVKHANAGVESMSEDDFDNDGGQSPIFESHVHDDDADDSDDEEEVSRHKSRRKRSTVSAMNLSLDLKSESTGVLSDHRKRKFFPPGPLCSLQFLDEIEDGDFDTPLWRRMKRKRSSLTSVKRGKAAAKAKKLRQSH